MRQLEGCLSVNVEQNWSLHMGLLSYWTNPAHFPLSTSLKTSSVALMLSCEFALDNACGAVCYLFVG